MNAQEIMEGSIPLKHRLASKMEGKNKKIEKIVKMDKKSKAELEYKTKLALMMLEDNAFPYLEQFFNKPMKGNISENNTIGFYDDMTHNVVGKRYTKNQFIKILSGAGLKGKVKEKFENLCSLCDINALSKTYENEKYAYKLGANTFEWDIKKFIDFLKLPDSERKAFFEEKDPIKLKNNKIFCSALKNFFRDKDIFNNYFLGADIKKIVEIDIGKNQAIDTTSIYHSWIDEKEAGKYDELELDQDFIDYIFDGMPEDFNKLEKAAYAYIKMCKSLSYDSEYYAARGKPEAAKNLIKKHENIERLRTVNLENNQVVCGEFTAMYAKILNNIGIKYNIRAGVHEGAHQYLEFADGQCIVKADSTTSIFYGDLIGAKANMKLVGLECYNSNPVTRNIFDSAVDKAYKAVNKNVNSLGINEFDRLKEEYLGETQGKGRFKYFASFEEKMALFINALKRVNLKGMDLISYVQNIKKIFAETSNFKLDVKTMYVDKEMDKIEPITILSFTSTNFDVGDITYYAFNDKGEIELVDKTKIAQGLEQNTIKPIDLSYSTIPGIKVSSKLRSNA